ncbi:MAG: DUF2508 family protein [Thermincola sp.]|nr:DUF2508 family protein [Thermincola sp.]MDT3702051.1 DUF2508 family protein [Thermincola sp.]
MKGSIIKLKNKILDLINVGQAVGQVLGQPVEQEQDFFEQLKEAHREWQIALNNYNFSSDPDFVDYSIFNIDAREREYIYLIKRARKENIVMDLKIDGNDFATSFDNQ